jgi:hypothetical protein
LKKRSKELLLLVQGPGPKRRAAAGAKVFWFFSSEKNAFLPY